MNARKRAIQQLKGKVHPWGHNIDKVITRFDEITFVLDDGREAVVSIAEAMFAKDLQLLIEQRLIPCAPGGFPPQE